MNQFIDQGLDSPFPDPLKEFYSPEIEQMLHNIELKSPMKEVGIPVEEKRFL